MRVLKAEITLESLIKDITDEARTNDSTKTINGQALYGNKLNSNSNNSNANNKKGNKGGNRIANKRPDCKHCKQPKPLYPSEDCFVINKELREAFKNRTSKKAILYFKRIKNKKSGRNNNKKKDDKEVDGKIFSHALLLIKEPLVDASSIAFYTSSNKNRWLYDIKATDHSRQSVLKSEVKQNQWLFEKRMTLAHLLLLSPATPYLQLLRRLLLILNFGTDVYAMLAYKQFATLKRCDEGKEYSFKQMKELADHLSILLKKSTPYTLEQNGRSERSIRTLIEKLRIATIDQEIPDQLTFSQYNQDQKSFKSLDHYVQDRLNFDNNLEETEDEEATDKLPEPYKAPSPNDKKEVEEEVEEEVVSLKVNDKTPEALTIRRPRKIYPQVPLSERVNTRSSTRNAAAALSANYFALRRKETWSIIKKRDILKGGRILSSRLLFKTKKDKNEKIERYKVRFVV
ncbi:hypothetical protein MBM_08397 [Drepanopeziza brunnea f. sp. 'multigermtubi' MB_m1]|uniref:Integrase catalytic domain-containing protein n=1 Tax=Marssonina brunnea f. sp. multigermtubi (strain MB_m1) TaxID=1072389 RepID=K1XLH7_MARBU|nr:uncharacterized protein MBM_08397 [Drepanopeziza brunnea f. sp. 'multigermtubi' MB_m1]EKD13314.1 hypothetical protein MBM_08397 [Drepanopeziza brunnea f. sp. 'multigermtubi' MB_m1]